MIPTHQELDVEVRYRLRRIQDLAAEGARLVDGLEAGLRRLRAIARSVADAGADLEALEGGREDPPGGP